mgnify:CR=1 FL=1
MIFVYDPVSEKLFARDPLAGKNVVKKLRMRKK